MKTYFLFLFYFICIISYSQEKKFSFEECINLAIINNYDLKNSVLNLVQTSYKIKQSKGDFLPQLHMNLLQYYDYGSTISPSTNLREERNRTVFNGSITANWTFFEGLKRKYNLEISKINYEISYEEDIKLKREISQQILDLFTDILIKKEKLKIEELNLDKDQKLLDLINKKIKLGTEIIVNSKIIEAKILKDSVNINKYNKSIKLSLLSLSNLLGLDYEIDIYINDLNELNHNYLYNSNLTENSHSIFPELKILQQSIDKENLNYKIIQSNYYPKISFRYYYNSFYSHILNKNSKDDDFFSQIDKHKNHYIGISLIFPIFNQFNNSTKSQISKIELQKFNYMYKKKFLEISNYIKKLSEEINLNKEEYVSQKKYLDVFNEILIINIEKYNLGLISLFELNNYIKEYEIEEQNLIQSKIKFFYANKIFEIYFSKY